MEELLDFLFAAAIQFSGLPGLPVRPPLEALPYKEMLVEVCADLRAELPAIQATYDDCAKSHKMMPVACEGLRSSMKWYGQCLQQRGLVAAYIIGEHRIVYREELDLDNDSDNSFIVHEFVHALQAKHFGDQLFDTCDGVLASEREAYRAQQQYLNSRGQLLRVGERLRYVGCGDVR